MPTFLGIGATKSGTSSLRYYLKQHKDIYIPDGDKEPGFFCYGGDNNSIHYRVKTERQYARLFDGVKDEKAYGEITPHYLRSPYAPQNIKQHIPGAKLIVSIRNPIERAFSIYLMNLRNKNHNRGVPFNEALIGDQWTRSFYFDYIKNFFDIFNREQIKIILFEDIVADPVRTSQSIFSFLGVDATFAPDVSKVVNPGGLPRFKFLHTALNNRTARKIGYYVVPTYIHNKLEYIKNANLRPQRMSAEDRAIALEVFREDILKT